MSRNNYKGKNYRKDASSATSTSSNSGKTSSKGRNYNRNSSKKAFDKRETPDAKKNIKDAINDISWYAKNPSLLANAASIPFSQMLGLPMDYGKWNDSALSPVTDALPGLMLIPTVPCFGSWGDESSILNITYPYGAINVAAENLYSFIRHENSGHSNYDAPDLMVYVMAMDQLYSYHAELTRLYGVTRFYSGFNRYLGRYLVEALDYDYDDIVANLARLRYDINVMAAKMSTFAVPAIFPMFERHRNIYSSIYMDDASVKAQCYAYIPYARGIYNEPVDADGHKIRYMTGLKAKEIGFGMPTKRTITDIENDINEMIAPLLHSEDIGIMSGDILKAYGQEKCYQVNALPEDWMVGPVFVPTVLKQIHNSTTIGAPVYHTAGEDQMMLWQNGTAPIIYSWTQSKNNIPLFYEEETTPGAGIRKAAVKLNPHIVDTDIDNPGPEEVMEITRMMAIANSQVVASAPANIPFSNNITIPAMRNTCTFKAMGADAAVCYLLFTGNRVAVSGEQEFVVIYTHTIVKDGSEGPKYFKYREAVADISKFNWHPTLYEWGVNATGWVATGNPAPSLRVTSQLDNCVMIHGDTLDRLHDVALLSLLDVPTTTLSRGI